MDKIKALIAYLEETDARRNELIRASTELIYSNIDSAELKEINNRIETLAKEAEIRSVRKDEESEDRYIVQVGYDRLIELTGNTDSEPYLMESNESCQWEHYREIVEDIELVALRYKPNFLKERSISNSSWKTYSKEDERSASTKGNFL